MTRKVTKRQVDALRILAADPGRAWNASMFAMHFWPDKKWLGGSSRDDASARHGGRMLHRLVVAGLVTYQGLDPHGFAVRYQLTEKGKAALVGAEGAA